jgi:hypothetical protein
VWCPCGESQFVAQAQRLLAGADASKNVMVREAALPVSRRQAGLEVVGDFGVHGES